MRRAYAITTLAAAALVMAIGAPAYAAPGDGNGKSNGNPPAHASGIGNNGNGAANDDSPNGANGTVKVHYWPEHKNSSGMANDPKVCQFELHGSNFDSAESEGWWIQDHKWGSGDRSKAVLTGTYTANGDGDWTSGPHELADGHYKLFVEMEHGTSKHKVFKVDCPPPNVGEEGDDEGDNDEGDNDEGDNDEGDNDEGDNDEGVTGQHAAVGVQLGVEQGPTGSVSPIVEQPAGGAAQAGAQVAGQQAAPITALPATSTDE